MQSFTQTTLLYTILNKAELFLSIKSPGLVWEPGILEKYLKFNFAVILKQDFQELAVPYSGF